MKADDMVYYGMSERLHMGQYMGFMYSSHMRKIIQ